MMGGLKDRKYKYESGVLDETRETGEIGGSYELF